MKRLAIIIFAVGLMLLPSCKLFEHVHQASSEWSVSAVYHWKTCTHKGCKEVLEREQHEFKNGVCLVCGYEKETLGDAEKD